MPLPPLSKLVKDWGGFERLVAKLHDTGTVQVEHDVVLTGKSGAPRQCDVVIRHREGLYEHLIIVECKYWQENVSRLHVDALATAVKDLKASKGVIMTAKGFQSGAKTLAAHEGIELYLLRELTDDEWGPLGPVVEVVLQLVTRTLGNIVFHGARKVGAAGVPIKLSINLGRESTRSFTPLLGPDGTTSGSLEQLLTDKSLQALQRFAEPTFTINGGEACTRYMGGLVNLRPERPIVFKVGDEIAIVDGVSFDLGIKYVQSPIRFDRRDKFAFVLAVQDCITSTVTAASRELESQFTQLTPLVPSAHVAGEDELVNGSVIKVILNSWFPFTELQGLKAVPAPELLRVGSGPDDGGPRA